MSTTVRKDSFKTTNMRFSDLDDKFFNNTNSGVRRIKMSKFVRKTDNHIANGTEFKFKGTDLQPSENVVGSGSRLRLEDKYATGPKDAIENIYIKTTKNNMSMSHYKNSITFYKVQQTGVDDYQSHSNGYQIHDQNWGGNLRKNIPKEFEQFGTFGASSVDKYACVYNYEFAAINLQFQIKGGIYGAGAQASNQNGGNAMYVNNPSGDTIPIRIASTAQVYAGGGWGGNGGKGGPGGKGGGTTTTAGGAGGAGGDRGTGGAGKGYTTEAANGTDGESGGDGGGRNSTTWYNGGLSDVNFKFRQSSDFHSGGVPVEATGIGFRCISFTLKTDDNPESDGTCYTKITGNFFDKNFTFWHPEEDENQESETKSTQKSGRLLVMGGTTGELAVSHDSDSAGKKASRQSDSKCIFKDKDGDDANATLKINQHDTNFRYRQSRNFTSGKGGDGGDGGKGGSGGDWGQPGNNGASGSAGDNGEGAKSDNRPKFIRNTGASNMNISVNGTRTGDYYSVFAVPGLGDYGDSSGNGYGDKTAWNVPSNGYVGPISHWSYAPWNTGGGQILMGAWTQVQDSGRKLGLDDNGSFNGPDNDYNDLILKINDGSWPQAKFVHHNPAGEAAPTTWDDKDGESGTDNGIAISGTGYKLINQKTTNYKGDPPPD